MERSKTFSRELKLEAVKLVTERGVSMAQVVTLLPECLDFITSIGGSEPCRPSPLRQAAILHIRRPIKKQATQRWPGLVLSMGSVRLGSSFFSSAMPVNPSQPPSS